MMVSKVHDGINTLLIIRLHNSARSLVNREPEGENNVSVNESYHTHSAYINKNMPPVGCAQVISNTKYYFSKKLIPLKKKHNIKDILRKQKEISPHTIDDIAVLRDFKVRNASRVCLGAKICSGRKKLHCIFYQKFNNSNINKELP